MGIEFGNMARRVGNALGGDFKSKDEIRKEKLTAELASVNEALNNIRGFTSDSRNFAPGDHGAITHFEREASKIQQELDLLNSKN